MKRYISYLICAVAVILAVGCAKVEIQPFSANPVAMLQLKNSDLVETRAAGVEDLNENYIRNIQCFFSVNGTTVDYATGVIEVDKNDSGDGVEQPLEISSDVLEKVFPNGATTCNLYVLANGPVVGEVATIDAIKAMAITLESYGAEGPKAQSSFVMDGMTTVTKAADNSITGTVDLTRAAAKIEVELKVEKQIVIGKDKDYATWTPDLTNVKITYNQSVTKSTVNAEPADASERASYAQTAQPFTFTTADAQTYSTGKQNMPFYSYPSAWDDNNGETAANILLEIPWKKGEDAEYLTYRYQIPVNFDGKKLVRNNIYKLSINVGILGALDGVVDITPSYIVVDWQSHEINTELSRPKYLVVDQNYVVMNNVEKISVNYQSSDDVTAYITGFKCSFYYPNEQGNATIREINATYPVDQKLTNLNDVAPNLTGFNFSLNLNTETRQVTLTHSLDNVVEDKIYHYFPYEITVRVTNTETRMYEDITFVQYPALYVTWDSMTKSTVFVNSNSARNQGWWWVRGSYSNSPDMYTVTVSTFDQTTADYIIADPREPANNTDFVFYNNINGVNSGVRQTGTDASGDNTLTGYRATVSGAVSEHLIAPQMLWSSSYISNGGNSINTYNYLTNGKYRCAGYQENGYPAGRWRLPTPAEILYMARLDSEGKVDGIFVNNVVYLSSNGGYRVLHGNGGSVTKEGDTAGSLRCVYDIWYWKDKCEDVDQFIWGAEGDIANNAKSDYLVSVE